MNRIRAIFLYIYSVKTCQCISEYFLYYFQKQFSQAPRLAGLMFEIHLFVEDWGPVDMNAQMYITRFLNSTGALSAPPKYVYLSTCVNLTSIHGISPSLGYST